VREVGIQIARALEAAHAADIVHRDVKPANILARNDAWKLADFGIAKMPDSTLTREGTFIGSPSYAAPESLRDGTFGPASDVYGLAATLYEALAGSPPHGDHELLSVARKLDTDPPPLDCGAVGEAIMSGLARDPAARPTAGELARLLARDDRSGLRRPSPALKVVALCLAALAIGIVTLAVLRRTPTAVAQDHEVPTPVEVAPITPPPPPAPAATPTTDDKKVDKPTKRRKKKKTK
jgi:serine/threonine protein kinase